MNTGDFDVPIVEEPEDLNSFQLRQMAEGYLTKARLPGGGIELFKRCEVTVPDDHPVLSFVDKGDHVLLNEVFQMVTGAIKDGYGTAESNDDVEKSVKTGDNYALAVKVRDLVNKHFEKNADQNRRFVTADITLLKDKPGKVKYAYLILGTPKLHNALCEDISKEIGLIK